jgi:MFS family permease
MNETAAPERESRYGWVMVVLAAVFMGVGSGSLGALAVFIRPLGDDLGWLRGQTTVAYMVGAIGMGLSGVASGWLSDRYSARPVVLFGAVALAVTYVLLSRVQALWQFYALYAMLTVLGAGTFDAPLLANLGNWFERNKGLAFGLATAGRSLGQGLLPFAAGVLIVHADWRQAYWVLGLGLLALLVPGALLIRRSPAERVQRAGGPASAAERSAVYPIPARLFVPWLGGAAIFCCVCMSTAMVNVVSLAQDQGLVATTAAGVLLVIFVAGFAGRVFFGRLADSIGGLRSYLCASASQTVLVFWFTQVHSAAGFYVIAALFGFGFSGVMTCVVVCVREFVALPRRGVSQGGALMLAWAGMGLGGWQGGFFYDLTGSYTLSFANAALAGVINLTLVGALYLYAMRRFAALLPAPAR